MKSFAAVHPELLKEWDRSNELKPDKISYGSNKAVLWRGSCGHLWKATIKNRGSGHGCPYCSGNKVLIGFNDLASQRPVLAKEWSVLNRKKPEDYTKRSVQRVYWKCRKCGHIWKARIADRSEGHGCPACAGAIVKEGYNDLKYLYPGLAAEWSERNKTHPSKVFPKSRQNVWWKCHICGNEWMAVVDSRVKGSGCHRCIQNEKKRRRAEEIRKMLAMKRNSIGFYAERSGYRVSYRDDSIIGISLQIFFPEIRAAVEYSSKDHRRGNGRRREYAKNWLCINSGIKMIRILDEGEPEFNNCICITRTDGSPEVLEAAVTALFGMMGINADIDFKRDMEDILTYEITFGPTVQK